MPGRWPAVPVALLAAALAAAALAPAPAEATHLAPALGLNVVHARDLGCSNDAGAYGEADLRVSVLLDGRLALRTLKAQDHDEPWFGDLVPVSDPGRPVQVTIRVEEAEPDGFFGTAWRLCDASPDAQQEFVATWSGGVQEYVARGGSAEAIVVLGPAPAAVPVPQAAADADSITFTWPAVAGTPHLATERFAAGPALPAGATSHRLDGLCDGQWHQASLAVVAHPWQVRGPPAAARTADVAPQAPRVLSAAASPEGWRVEWESRTTHDVARYEVLVGPDAAAPPAAARGSVAPFSDWSRQSTTVPSAAGDAYAWVRTVDLGGHVATSAAFTLGSPALPPSGQSSWTQLDPCTPGLATEPTDDPAAPDVAKDVFAAEAGHPASGPSPSGGSAGSETWTTIDPSDWPVRNGTGGPQDGSGGTWSVSHRPVDGGPVAPGETAAEPRSGAIGWAAVALVGFGLFVLLLVAVTRQARRR